MATTSVKIIAVFLIFGVSFAQVWTKCTIDINKDYTVSSPLILNEKTFDIVYPEKTSSNVLSFKPNQEYLAYCTGGYITKCEKSTGSTIEVSKCKNDQIFSDPKNHECPFNKISCSGSSNPITKQDDNRKCKDGVVVDIGYQVTKDKFVKIIDLCYVKDLATTKWSHSKISSAIGGSKNREFRAPSFSKGSFFNNVLMSQVYPKSNQQQTFMAIFNDKRLVDKYLPQEQRKNYFVKGHLVARADMYYYAEQNSTYFYINVLPMWQSINNGNWKSVESIVRRTASIQGKLDVWTGGIGILKLSGKDIFLSKDKKNNSKMLVPAPKLLFKLVYDKMRNEGLVFLTVNDPYFDGKELPESYSICAEYSTCSNRFSQFRQRFEGYTYCCLVEDFLKYKDVGELDLPIDFKLVEPMKLR